MWQFLSDWSDIAPAITSIFAGAAFLVALVGARTALRQLRENLKSQRETTSKNIWRDYLKLTIEHPEFTTGGFNKLTGKEREQYKWFVANFLWGVEELLTFVGDDSVWRHNLIIQAQRHRDYFLDPTFRNEDYFGYSPQLRDFVDEAIGQQTGVLAMPDANEPSDQDFIVRWTKCALEIAGIPTLFSIAYKVSSRIFGFTKDNKKGFVFVNAWVLFFLGLSVLFFILSFALKATNVFQYFVWIALIIFGLRLWEYAPYILRVSIFTIANKGKTDVYDRRRTVILGLLNYLEMIF